MSEQPSNVISLSQKMRFRLVERALEEAWARRLADLEAEERETRRTRLVCPPRLRVVR